MYSSALFSFAEYRHFSPTIIIRHISFNTHVHTPTRILYRENTRPHLETTTHGFAGLMEYIYIYKYTYIYTHIVYICQIYVIYVCVHSFATATGSYTCTRRGDSFPILLSTPRFFVCNPLCMCVYVYIVGRFIEDRAR